MTSENKSLISNVNRMNSYLLLSRILELFKRYNAARIKKILIIILIFKNLVMEQKCAPCKLHPSLIDNMKKLKKGLIH